MKITFKNRIIKAVGFNDVVNAKSFYEKQKTLSKIELIDTFGDYQYIINSIDSLTREVLFSLMLSTDIAIEKLNLAVFSNGKKWLLETDENIYLLSLKGKIISTLNKETPLIGFHFLKKRLLILEEAGFRVINFKGEILVEKATDLIENFEFKNQQLFIITTEGKKLNFSIA